MTDTKQKPRVVDDPSIREVYADKLIGVSFDGSTIVATVGAVRMIPKRIDDAPTPECCSIHIAARLAFSPRLGIELVQAISATMNVRALAQAVPQNASGEQAQAS
jgi:hypothetical protein